MKKTNEKTNDNDKLNGRAVDIKTLIPVSSQIREVLERLDLGKALQSRAVAEHIGVCTDLVYRQREVLKGYWVQGGRKKVFWAHPKTIAQFKEMCKV